MSYNDIRKKYGLLDNTARDTEPKTDTTENAETGYAAIRKKYGLSQPSQEKKPTIDLLHPEKRVQQENAQTIPSMVVQDIEQRYNDARLAGDPKSAAAHISTAKTKWETKQAEEKAAKDAYDLFMNQAAAQAQSTTDVDPEKAQQDAAMLLSAYQRARNATARAEAYYKQQNEKFGGIVDYYDKWWHLTEEDGFQIGTAKRDYKNPTKQELFDYDSSETDGSIALSSGGYFDDAGNILDAQGNLVRSAEGPVIEDRLALYLSASEEDIALAPNTISANGGAFTDTYANLLKEGAEGNWQELDELEVELYYKIKEQQGDEAAYAYLKDTEEILNKRAGSKAAKEIAAIENDTERFLATAMLAVESGLQQWGLGVKQIFADGEVPTSAALYASAEVQESLDGLAKYAYMAANQVGYMLPSIFVSKFLGLAGAAPKIAQVAGVATMGSSAGGNAYGQALKEGYDKERAACYGVLVGASEATLQYLIGGIDDLGGISNEKILSKLSTIDNVFLKLSAKWGYQITDEIKEEELQNYLEPVFRNVLFGEDYDMPTLEEQIETAIVTALSTSAMNAGGNVTDGAAEIRNHINRQHNTVGTTKQQPQSGSAADANAQTGNGQVAQETAVKAAPGTLEWALELNDLGAGKKTNTTEKPRISMADFANQESPVWRNVAYNDDATKASIMQDTHDAMVAEGVVVKVADGVAKTVDQAYPDLRSMKKKERTPILKSAMTRLKTDLRQFLNGFKNQSFEFDVNGQVLDATLYSTGINEVMEKVTKEKANMLYSTEAIFRNARYLYSTPDYDGDPNVYRWNYFYTPVQIGEATVGVRIAVRDLAKQGESQIYNWGIKKDASLGGVGGGINNRISHSASSDASADTSLDGVRDDLDNRKPYGISSDVSNNNIPQTVLGVNTNSPTANESVGAAPAWFDVNTRLQYEYGTIPEGENPVRSDDLPKKDYTGEDVSYTARTVKGAEVTPDSFVDLLNKETAEGGLSYVKITNDATVQKAIDHIKDEGWDVAKAMWHADVRAGKAGADLSAVGALLLNNAAKAGDKAAWLDVLHDYQLLGTNTAQGLQALRILKQLSPSDKLYMAKRSVKQMVKDMKLDTDVAIDPELETEYNEATTDEERDAVLVKIQKNVAQQLPTTFMEKFTALRYVNMLGNLRTQVRNIAGNITMKGTRVIHNTIASGIEAVVNKVSGGKVGRTRSATVSKAQKAAAAKDFESLQKHILDGGKYSDNMTATGFARGVQEQKQIFKFKPLEGYRKVTNWAMEQGDLIFAKDAYARALAGYLKANGITETDYSKIDPAVMDDARLFAAKEAQEATFRDTNWLSGWVSKAGRRKTDPAPIRVLSEGIMPFRKTPANVLVRAEEYSPLGIFNSVVTSVQKIAGNTKLTEKYGLLGDFARAGQNITGTQVINSWAKSLTGTGLFGMGMLLQSLGLLSAGPDDDENKDSFEDLNGWQDYALTLPDGTNLTIDFLSPSAIPVLMGAQLMNEIRENGFDLKDIDTALTSITDPMVEMSMLQGVNDSLENIQYADSTLGQLVINAAVSYLTQGLTNTLAGQLERSFEDSRMQTYVDKDSELPAWLQKTLGKASAKKPGWDYSQIPYINAWGEEEKNPSTGLNLVYNLLSPSYFDKGKDDDLTRELNRLNDVQSDVNVYPSAPDKTMQINKQDYNLSAEEYVALAKLQGQTQKQIVEDIIANSYYDQLSDEDKATAIRYAYDYARDLARGEVVEAHPGITTKWMQSIGADPAEGIIRHIAVDDNYISLSVSDADYITNLLEGLRVRADKIDAIAGSKLSEKDQKAVLEDTLDDKGYAKYLRVLALGLDTDDYADSYRTYSESEGSGKKERTIKQYQKEFGLSYNTAKKLYEIYDGAK